jgi:Holliday junction resolvase RusA-like endonuclease
MKIIEKLNLTSYLTFDIIPCPAPRMTRRDKWPDTSKYPRRECVKKYFAFKNEVIWTSKKLNYQLSDELNIIFVIPMPESWSEKKKIKMVGQPHKVKPDVDNLTKAWMDSFGVNDGFVWNIQAIKIWGRNGKIIVY